MAEKLDGKETLIIEELVVGNSYELSAMFNVLDRKGLINKAEFLGELKRLRKEVKPPVDPDPYVIRD